MCTLGHLGCSLVELVVGWKNGRPFRRTPPLAAFETLINKLLDHQVLRKILKSKKPPNKVIFKTHIQLKKVFSLSPDFVKALNITTLSALIFAHINFREH